MTTTAASDRDEEPARHHIGSRLASARRDERAVAWADKLWSSVRAADEHSALDVVGSALAAGLDAETVLLEVIGAVQHRVGAEWAANRLSVVEEHAATAINDRVIAALSADRPATFLGRVTVACVDKEWHALPARLLAETLRLRGWQVGYLGAQVPTAHLVSHVHRTGADTVCLSAALSTRLPMAHAAITAVQAVGTPVMVGGLAFGADGRWARQLGADAWAPEARAAADRLAAGPCPGRGHPTRPSTTCRICPTRNSPWSPGPPAPWSARPSRDWNSASPPCAATTTTSVNAPPRTSPTSWSSWPRPCTWTTRTSSPTSSPGPARS